MKIVFIMLSLVLGGLWMNAAALEDSSEVYPVPQKVMSDYAEFPVKSAGISFVPLFDEAPDEALTGA